MKNTVEIKNNIVTKVYASRIDFLREDKIYKMLQGTGLCPKLIDSADGKLEHEFVPGETFLDLLSSSEGDFSLIEKYFGLFYSWYAKYREITKMNIGQVRFEKMIVSGDTLCCIEFENCKPGYIEEDIARLVAQMCMIHEPYSEYGIEMARLFVSIGAQNLEWKSEILMPQIHKALLNECESKSIPPNTSKNEYIAVMMCATGIVLAGGQTPIEECGTPLIYNPQRIISAPKLKGIGEAASNFKCIQTLSGIDNSLNRVVESQEYSNQVWTLILTTDMPRIPKLLWDAQISCEKEGCAAVVIKAGGKLREFPLLLNNSLSRLELKNSLSNGETSLIDALKKLPIKIIELESLYSR